MRNLHLVSAVASLSIAVVTATAHAQIAVTPSDTVDAPKSRLGIGVNGSRSWFNLVGANLVDDPSFEGEPNENGLAHDGWPWAPDGGMTASVDTTDFVSGVQSQRIDVTQAPATISQGRVELPQAPLVMTARTTSVYRIKVMAKSDTAGARLRLGAVNEGWQEVLGPEIAITDTWQEYSWDYVPESEHLLRGFAVSFEDEGTYWLDNLVAWDTEDINEATGLSQTFVDRLIELAPDSLRLGGLGVNGIPLESYLRTFWDRDYGPPNLEPDFDINTFLLLCKEVGAQPFIAVPPAFSDGSSWQVGDLTDNVISNVYEDHGNFIDYLGGDSSTTYGARREAAGFSRWDLEFDTLYFELGNELWGTPDDLWDMDPGGNESQAEQMQNYATYCERRMSEMKGRPGWRDNMRVGFGGRSPTTWLGGWDGSYDGTLIPQIGSLTDFSTIDLYYGNGAATDDDATLFGALFANAPLHEREIAEMKEAFATANGGTEVETTVYEGNVTWGGYEDDLSNPSPLYYKSVSQGGAVSLLDVYAASNRAGVTVNNHFHYSGNVWGATGAYPEVVRKPAFYALKLFNRHLTGDLHACEVTGSETYDDPLTGESSIPYLACYPYKQDHIWTVLLINRHLTDAQDIEIPVRLAPFSRVVLAAADVNANNETQENVTLESTVLAGELTESIAETIPPHSAVVLVLSETGEPPPEPEPDPGSGGAGNTTGAGGTQAAGNGNTSGNDTGGSSSEGGAAANRGGSSDNSGCGCRAAPPFGNLAWLAALALTMVAVRRRNRRQD